MTQSPPRSTKPVPPKGGIIRRGFGLKAEISGQLDADYHSSIVETILENQYHWQSGGLSLRLAKAFGFCYGVDKAIDFAYETVRRFPDRRIFLTNEIIHNPRVNRRLIEMGIRILSRQGDNGDFSDKIGPEDVVIIPAFGIETGLLDRLRVIGCVLVDTTCGSVVHVWKRVERYARDGYTAVIHGKWAHEETIATCSHVTEYEGGQYLVVRDLEEAQQVCDHIRQATDAEALAEKFRDATHQGFDFNRDLKQIGVANQTTMLSSESLAIADLFRQALADRWGEDQLKDHYHSFDTICTATQERQDAVEELMKRKPDLMLVVGGFNSSNTEHLCEIATQFCPAFHVDDVGCLISPDEIKHNPPGPHTEPLLQRDWLPRHRPIEIGLTAGASTPNKVVGEVIERLVQWEEASAEVSN
jgi:4-hydroxy-3-methylbut-2-enyl diphosphate reductase